MAGTITMLQIQKRNKSRVNLFLDDEYAFSLSLNVAVTLKKGQQLSDAEIVQLRDADEQTSAYESALRFLGYRPRSRSEIEANLKRKEFSLASIKAALDRLAAEGYVDDAAFAQFWSENRQQFRPRSARVLQHELRQKGVERATIEEALTGLDEEAAAWAAVENKLARWSTLEPKGYEQKFKGFLARRGFSYDIVERVWQRAKKL